MTLLLLSFLYCLTIVFSSSSDDSKKLIQSYIRSLSPRGGTFALRAAIQKYLDDKQFLNHPIREFAFKEGKMRPNDVNYDVALRVATRHRDRMYDMLYDDFKMKLQQMESNWKNGNCITEETLANLSVQSDKTCRMPTNLGKDFISNLLDYIEAKFLQFIDPIKSLKDKQEIARINLGDNLHFVIRLKLQQDLEHGLLAISHNTVVGFVGTFEKRNERTIPVELNVSLTSEFDVTRFQMILKWEASFGTTTIFQHKDDVKIEGPKLTLKSENGYKAFVANESSATFSKRELAFTLCKGIFLDSVFKTEAKIPIGKAFNREDGKRRLKFEVNDDCKVDLGSGEIEATFQIKAVKIKTTFNLHKFLHKVFNWNVNIPDSIMRAIQHAIDFVNTEKLAAMISKLLEPIIPDDIFGSIDLLQIMRLGETFGKQVKSVINAVKDIIERVLLQILNAFKFFEEIWKKVEQFLSDVAHKTKDWFEQDFADFWKNDVRDFFENDVQGFFRDDIGGFLRDDIGGFFENDVRKFFENDVRGFFENDVRGFVENDVREFFENDIGGLFR